MRYGTRFSVVSLNHVLRNVEERCLPHGKGLGMRYLLAERRGVMRYLGGNL